MAVLAAWGGMRPAAAVGLCYVAAVTVPLWRADADERRLPDRLVIPGFAFAAVGCAWDALSGGSAWWAAPAGTVVIALFFAALELSGGVGMGDVKLAALLAACLVPAAGTASPALLAGFVAAAFVAAGCAAVAATLHPAAEWGRTLPFGPFLLGSFWLAVALR